VGNPELNHSIPLRGAVYNVNEDLHEEQLFTPFIFKELKFTLIKFI